MRILSKVVRLGYDNGRHIDFTLAELVLDTINFQLGEIRDTVTRLESHHLMKALERWGIKVRAGEGEVWIATSTASVRNFLNMYYPNETERWFATILRRVNGAKKGASTTFGGARSPFVRLPIQIVERISEKDARKEDNIRNYQ